MHSFQIEGIVRYSNGALTHHSAAYVAENEAQAVQDFLSDRKDSELISRPIVIGNATITNVNQSRECYILRSRPIIEPEEIKRELEYFQLCERNLLDMGDFLFEGREKDLIENRLRERDSQLNSESRGN